MPAPVELSLASLLPTISFLPPDLIALANSLVSQSRSKAASLNRDEEIARTYACCHLACKRLAKQLELEIGKPSPPVAPRVYTKLLGYLEGVLGRTGGTPRKNVGDGTPKKKDDGKKESVKTPSRTATAVTPTAGSKKRAREEAEVEKDVSAPGVPEFGMPLLRHVCKALGVPAAAPHVLVGAQAALKELSSRAAARRKQENSSRKRRKTPQSAKSTRSVRSEPEAEEEEKDAIATDQWPALLVALTISVVEKMLVEENPNLRKEAIDAAKEFCKEHRETIGADLRSIGKDVDFYALEADDSGWLEMEWFANVPENTISTDQDDEVEDSAMEVDEEGLTPAKSVRPSKTPLRRKEKHGGKLVNGIESVGAAGLLPGLGTMFQPALDWLSEERRREFSAWKKGIMKEIMAVEQRA